VNLFIWRNNFRDCFGRVFPKTRQYGATNEKMCKNWKYVFIKSTQFFCKSASLGPNNLGREVGLE
jgi:hypothetical protein